MTMKPIIIAAAAALGLTACAQVTDVARGAIHPQVDKYCAETPREIRETARLSLGTTEAGNRILVDCAVDHPDPKVPES